MANKRQKRISRCDDWPYDFRARGRACPKKRPESQRPEGSLPRARSLDPSAPPVRPSRRCRIVLPRTCSPHVQAADDELVPAVSWRDRWTLRETAGFLVSLIVHVALMLILSLLVVSAPPARRTDAGRELAARRGAVARGSGMRGN